MLEVASGASRCPEPLQVCTEKFIYRSFDKNEQYPIYCIYCFIINRGLYIAFCKPAVVPWCANSHGGGEGEEPLAGAFFFFFFLSFLFFTLLGFLFCCCCCFLLAGHTQRSKFVLKRNEKKQKKKNKKKNTKKQPRVL